MPIEPLWKYDEGFGILHRSSDLRPLKDRPLNQYALQLLRDLGIAGVPHQASVGDHPARQLADSGLLNMTANDTPVMCPVPLTACANGTLNAFRALCAVDVLPGVTGSQLLMERAAITGAQYDDPARPRCHLLSSSDGTIGLNLARAEDWTLLPAWLQTRKDIDWPLIKQLVRSKTSQQLLDQGRLLGLAVADATNIPSSSTGWVTMTSPSSPAVARSKAPRVVDLSSLWAGPVCSRLWQSAGADVVKIESSQRPDGARAGSPEFFDLLNAGKTPLTLDLHQPSGHRALLDLIRQADIVLEASRPRALRQMGIIAEDLIEEVPGLTWVSITGYGRGEPQGNWIAYGDDAGVAAGLSAIVHQVSGQWLVYGDAIADPLTGLHAALAGWAGWAAGGNCLVDLSLARTVQHCISASAPSDNDYCGRQQRWQAHLEKHNIRPIQPKRTRGTLSSAPS